MHNDGNIRLLTIGGFDPSAGAGITADLKTWEAMGLTGCAVQTCLTVQHESEVRAIYWHTADQIDEQIDVLCERYTFPWVKMSLVRDLPSALRIAERLEMHLPGIHIAWDPVMQASAGRMMADHRDPELLEVLFAKLRLVTPNRSEAARWGDGSPEENAARWSATTDILLTGGHDKDHPGRDQWFGKDGSRNIFDPESVAIALKHGSGCVFASALAGCLSRGLETDDAIREAKRYIIDFLNSDPGLLGRHPAGYKTDAYAAG